MAGTDHVHILGSVGRGGLNSYFDVRAVQEIINAHLPPSLAPLKIDGAAGPRTIAAIEEIERRYIHMAKPDGRLDPHGPTLRRLNGTRKSAPSQRSAPPPPHIPEPSPRAAPAKPAAPLRAVAPASRPAARSRPKNGRVIPPAVIAAAQASQRRWKVPASVTIAQWSLESGWGMRMPRGSNNPFGIKAGKGQRFVLARTREEHKDGSSYYIMAPFRVFDTMEEAFDQHGKLLATHPAYKRARTHLADPDAYADALTGTYATDHEYGKTLKGQMRAYDMYQYN